MFREVQERLGRRFAPRARASVAATSGGGDDGDGDGGGRGSGGTPPSAARRRPSATTVLWHWDLVHGTTGETVWAAGTAGAPWGALAAQEAADLRRLFSRGPPLSHKLRAASAAAAGVAKPRLQHLTAAHMHATISGSERREMDADISSALAAAAAHLPSALPAAAQPQQPWKQQPLHSPCVLPLEQLRRIAKGAEQPTAAVCRAQLECHLSPGEHQQAFGMAPGPFIALPKWKRQVLKKAASLF